MNHRNAFAFSIALLLTPVAQSAPPTPNYSDHWSSASEPGWGVGITQQDLTLFVTFLVYGPDSNPTWYTAVLTAAPDPFASALTFEGDLTATNGPWFASPPSSTNVTSRKAGTAKFTPSSSHSATLAYTVDGVAVSKGITRLTLRNESITGAYFGALTLFASCGTNIAINRQIPADIGIVRNDGNVAVTVTMLGGGSSCTYTGPYVQHGQVGEVTGSYACTTQEKGTFRISELRASVNGFVGRLEASFTSVEVNPGTACTGVGAIVGAYLGFGN